MLNASPPDMFVEVLSLADEKQAIPSSNVMPMSMLFGVLCRIHVFW